MKGTSSALILWLLIQLAALLLPIFQVRLADKFPRPAEKLAVDELLVVQVAAAGLLASVLIDTWPKLLANLAAMGPTLALAAILSANPDRRIILAGAYVGGWMVVLWGWCQILRQPIERLWLNGIAGTLALGGAGIAYLNLEFGPTASSDWGFAQNHGPIMAALALLHGGGWGSWAFLGCCGLATLLGFLTRRLTRKPV
jgi:hypothetical protein